MRDKIVLGEFRPGYREINVAAFQNEIINVTGEEIRWVVQRYLHRRMSGEELSNWAGLMLAIAAYVLPANESDDELLALLNDVALPLGNEYLDRETLKRRLG